MLDKDGEEHRAAENVLMRRAKTSLEVLLQQLTSLPKDIANSPDQNLVRTRIQQHLSQREKCAQQLRAMGTGARGVK